MGWFSRHASQPIDPQQMIDSQHARTGPTPGLGDTTPTAPTIFPGAFRMPVQDVFTITGRGVVATGTVAAGSIRVGQEVAVRRGGAEVLRSRVKSVEMFRKMLSEATAGTNVGLLLDGVRPGDVMAGDLLVGTG